MIWRSLAPEVRSNAPKKKKKWRKLASEALGLERVAPSQSKEKENKICGIAQRYFLLQTSEELASSESMLNVPD